MSTLRIGTLILVVAATMAFASTAIAKGEEKASCARIVNFSVTPSYILDRPAFTTSYSVSNGCVDHERMSAAALDSRNEATGFKGRAVNMLPYGLSTYTTVASNAPASTSFTFTLTVYAPNGKIAATRTQSVTTPAELTPAA
jgi:hypothetical protein